MRPLTRRGFTLMELVVVITLLPFIVGVLVLLVRSAGTASHRATDRLTANRALWSTALFLQQSLRSADSSDVHVIATTRIALSRPVGEALICADSGTVIYLIDSTWTGARLPQAHRDDLSLLTNPDSAWQRIPIDSVTPSHCPLTTTHATRVQLAGHDSTAALARVLEPIELSAYSSSGTDWFGITPASHSAAVQPIAGPIASASAPFSASTSSLAATIAPRNGGSTTLHFALGVPE